MGREEFSDTVKFVNSIQGVNKTNTTVIFGVVKDSFEFIPSVFDKEENR